MSERLPLQKIDDLASQRGGRVVAASEDENQVRIEFQYSNQAAGFYDEMITRYRSDEAVTFADQGMCVVLINQ